MRVSGGLTPGIATMVGTEPALAGYAESVNATLTDIFAALKTFRADWMARGWS